MLLHVPDALGGGVRNALSNTEQGGAGPYFMVCLSASSVANATQPRPGAYALTPGLHDKATLQQAAHELETKCVRRHLIDWSVWSCVSSQMALYIAATSGQLAPLRQLLALQGTRAVDVHADRAAALTIACTNGHVGVVRELLALQGSRKLDVHAWGANFALEYAIQAGHLSVVREFLALQGDRAVFEQHSGRGVQTVATAIAWGRVRIARQLLLSAPFPGCVSSLLAEQVTRWLGSSDCSNALQAALLDGAVRLPTGASPPPSSPTPSVRQQVLLHAIREATPQQGDDTQLCAAIIPAVMAYCTLCAALPGCAHASVTALLQAATPRGKRLNSVVHAPWMMEQAHRLQQLVWCGVQVRCDTIGGLQAGSGTVLQGLRRAGRRDIVLHRAAARG